jgi:hypothetical protein
MMHHNRGEFKLITGKSHFAFFSTSELLVGAELLAFLSRFELVVVSKTPSIDELSAGLSFAVIVPRRFVSFTRPGYFGQEACV